MKVTLRKILKIQWLIKQSLTKKPMDRQAMVSDLFIFKRLVVECWDFVKSGTFILPEGHIWQIF